MKKKIFNLQTFAKYSHYIILFLICAVMTVVSDNFLSFSNIISVLRQSSFLVVMSLGMMFAMILGRGNDMSIGAVVAITSCLGAQFLRMSCSPATIVLGIVISLGSGVLLGALNGSLIACLSLPALLVTYGMSNVLRGVVFKYMNLCKAVTFMGAGRVGSIPTPILIAAAFTLLSVFILKRTRLGRELYIVGANQEAARFSGIKTRRVIITGFALTGFMAGVAGLMYIGRLGTAEAQIGLEFHLNAIAAAAIGGVSFNGGVANPGGVVAGAIILSLLTNCMNLLNISSNWQGVMNGVIILFAVLLDYFANRKTR